MVEIDEAGRNACDLVFLLGGFFDLFKVRRHDLVHTRHIVALALLGDIEHETLGVVQNALDGFGVVEAAIADAVRNANELAHRRFFLNDLRVLLDVVHRRWCSGDLPKIEHAAGFFQQIFLAQLVGHGDEIDGLAAFVNFQDRLK